MGFMIKCLPDGKETVFTVQFRKLIMGTKRFALRSESNGF